ncbi:MAG TPA: DUF3761 domain-containing protein [Terracidiphilus sp.]|nr:DUF3761 domain-containing protein [Terracidiphilus sp.]
MKNVIRISALLAGLLVSQMCMAQAPAGAPAGATGVCNDGTYSMAASKSGACRGHKGIKSWFAASTTKATSAKAASTPAPAAAAAPAAAPAPKPAPAAAPQPKATSKTTAQAPGGGAGQVWLNTATNVYHCSGTQFYGKTKAGAYMTEADAKAKGAHPDHGKPCSK